MANLNKVLLIGRLTRDPETRTFANGGQVANIGLACNNRKKSAQTGQWEDEPVFIDMSAFGKTAELIAQYCHKGSQLFVEGRLSLDQWTDKDGGKRSKLKVIVDSVQFLDSKKDARQERSEPKPSYDGDAYEPPAQPASNLEIPF